VKPKKEKPNTRATKGFVSDPSLFWTESTRTRKMRIVICVIASFFALLVSCSRENPQDPQVSRYQLVASSDGSVYRLDVKTGAVMIINQGIMRSVSSGYEIKTGKYKVTTDSMPEPSTANKDQTVTDISTGMRYQSDGAKWVLIVEPRNPGETVAEYLKRTKDPLGIR
jgi:hypothetical protein